DNVLTGDYQQLATFNDRPYAAGGLLVHVRAIPEGGAAGALVASSLPYTFYDRFALSPLSRKSDRRQPLPALFAPRFIAGGPTAFNATLKIWREGITAGACSGAQAALSNSNMDIADRVRFDEHENATSIAFGGILTSGPPGLPATSALS